MRKVFHLNAGAVVAVLVRSAMAAGSADVLLTCEGRVVLPDGAPAAGAAVEIHDQDGVTLAKSDCDAAGRFLLRSGFLEDMRFVARSADGKHQATRRISAAEARGLLAKAMDVALTPALPVSVKVTGEGEAVAEVELAAIGFGTSYVVRGRSAADGQATLLVPADERVESVVAFDAKRGVGAFNVDSHSPQTSEFSVALHRPRRCTVHFVDNHSQPATNVPFMPLARVGESEWIPLTYFDGALAESDERGEATLDWLPADDLRSIDIHVLGNSWKVDECFHEKLDEGISTVSVRRQIPVAGTLSLPDGASPEGVLVAASGFGSGNLMSMPHARARKDGSFTLPTASDYGYAIGVSDAEWVSDFWTGNLLPADDATPGKLALAGYRAAPVTVRVTRARPPWRGESVGRLWS